jgi:linoleoyl-CoA desaturase
MGYMIVLPAYFLFFGVSAVLLAFVLNHFLVSIIFTSVLGVSHVSYDVQHPMPNKDRNLAISWPTLQMCTSVAYHANSTFLNWTLRGFNGHALYHILPNMIPLWSSHSRNTHLRYQTDL